MRLPRQIPMDRRGDLFVADELANPIQHGDIGVKAVQNGMLLNLELAVKAESRLQCISISGRSIRFGKRPA